MDKDTLFRMNFILQDSSATTTKTYLYKMIESILFDSSTPLSVNRIRELLASQYYLEFSNEEIINAINSKSNRNSHIIANENLYSLTPEYSNKLANADSVEFLMKKYIQLAIADLDMNISEENLYSLISKYLYFCFNTNKTVLLSLIEGTPIVQSENFVANNEEIAYINKFLQWKNTDKNKLLYQLISYCYIYCSLNTKKDILLSKSIFKKKHFYLDANIIFRLAGINNDDRQNTISSFINKCKEVGIKLSFTSSTFDEVYRVIESKVNIIKGITHSCEPLSIDLNAYGNDFYNLYIQWCKKPGNCYNDFNSFQIYLTELVNDVMTQLDYVDIKTSPQLKNKCFDTYVQSLKDYKYQNTYKPQSSASAKTDITNLLYLNEDRSSSSNESLFSTNVFFISADQILINWSKTIAEGVPLIVLPSVWLTILLRFTGRSNDDYQAFVSFMNLRSHNSVNDIDIFGLIRELGFHTDDKLLKEKIITEIIYHKNDYSFEKNNEVIIDKAFDTVREKDNQQLEDRYQKEILNREELLLKEKDEALKLSQAQERAKNISILVSDKIRKSQNVVSFINKLKYPFAIIIGALLIISATLWLYQINPCYQIYESIFPAYITDIGNKLIILGAAWAILILVYGFICHIINSFSSENHIKNLRSKYEKKYKKLLQ